MPMMTKRQLVKAYNNGQLEEVYKEVRRYGVIVKDVEWSIADGGRYDGAWRHMWINHHGLGWSFELHNGELFAAGYNLAPLIVGIHGQAVTEEENARAIRIRDYKPE